MSYSQYRQSNPIHRRESEEMLARLLPQARKMAVDEAAKMEINNPIGSQSFAHWSLANISGVHIYQTREDRWYADIIFKEVPLGVSPIIGTPIDRPMPTRFMAEDNAIAMLALIIQKDEGRVEVEDQNTVEPGAIAFDMDGIFFSLPADIVEGAVATFPDLVLSKARTMAEDQIYDMLKVDFGDAELTWELWDKLDPERRRRYYILATMMVVLSGKNRIRRKDEES